MTFPDPVTLHNRAERLFFDIISHVLRWTDSFSTLSLLAVAALLICAAPALATSADTLFGSGDSPLDKFVKFITGPFAYAVVIIALVVTVGVLAIGGEFSGFSRRMPIIVIAGGIVILAGQVLENLFGDDAGADLPPAILTPPVFWSEATPSEPVNAQRLHANRVIQNIGEGHQ